MQFERIRVNTQNHYRGAQKPSAFWWRDRLFVVERVIDCWYEGYVDATRVPLRYFRVQTQDGRQFILRYHELFAAWSLLVPAEDGE